MQTDMIQNPKRVLKDDALYFGDNGRIFCGRCAGMTATYTGRDISGQRVQRVTPRVLVECVRLGFVPECESCRKRVQS